jgi:hypothetical protein
MALGDDGLQDMVLQLPISLRARAEEMAAHECLSLNLFIASAIAERIQRLQLQICLDAVEHDEFTLSPPGEGIAQLH